MRIASRAGCTLLGIAEKYMIPIQQLHVQWTAIVKKSTQVDSGSSRDPEKWRIDDLADLSDLSIRTIRYYQTEGLLPPPAIEDRCAVYSRAHLDALHRIKEAKATRRLAQLYAETAASAGRSSPVVHLHRGDRVEQVLRCVVADGVEVLISAERAGLSREAIQTMISEISVMVRRRLQGDEEAAASLEPASPEGTVRLLDELVKLGLTDEQFRQLHPKPGETINRHLAYVGGRDAFRAGSINPLVNHRLQLCLGFLRDRALQPSSDTRQQLLDRCVDDAARAIPIP